MGQRTEGSFEAEGMSPSAVLQPWIAFVEQVTSPAELQALGHAVEAVRVEMQAVNFDYERAMWCLEHQWEGTSQELLCWQSMFTRDVQQAIWHWEQAGMWFREYGEQHKGQIYTSLCEHAHRQQQRVAQRSEELWERVVVLCQQGGIAIPGEVASSSTAAIVGEGW